MHFQSVIVLQYCCICLQCLSSCKIHDSYLTPFSWRTRVPPPIQHILTRNCAYPVNVSPLSRYMQEVFRMWRQPVPIFPMHIVRGQCMLLVFRTALVPTQHVPAMWQRRTQRLRNMQVLSLRLLPLGVRVSCPLSQTQTQAVQYLRLRLRAVQYLRLRLRAVQYLIPWFFLTHSDVLVTSEQFFLILQ